jgi:Tol biopolymer transport system component
MRRQWSLSAEGKRVGTAALLVVLVGCAGSGTVTDPNVSAGSAVLPVNANVGSAMAGTLVIEVTAPDIPTPLTFNLTLQDGAVSGTIVLPAGSDRTLTLRAYDLGGIETHRGSVTIDVREGTNPAVAVTLLPLSGDQPIDVILGTITVTVSPQLATVTVGETILLAATVTDSDGNVVDVTVSWASTNPSLATVDPDGLVTTRDIGDVQIVATYGGAAGLSELTIQPIPPTLVFQTNRDGNDEIYSMLPDGSGLTNLTSRAGFDGHASQTASGPIVFVSDRDNPNGEIYVMDGDGSNVVRVTNTAGPKRWPTWSPDRTQITFVESDRIHVIDVDGSNQRRLTTATRFEDDPTWSPDGTRIVFAATGTGGSARDLFVVNVDGTGEVNLTNTAADEGSAEWSPDGTKIAFTSTRDGDWDVYVMDADGSNVVQLTNTNAVEEHPTWSADGTRIIFSSNRDGNFELYVMNVDGSSQTRLTNDAASDNAPSWRR